MYVSRSRPFLSLALSWALLAACGMAPATSPANPGPTQAPATDSAGPTDGAGPSPAPATAEPGGLAGSLAVLEWSGYEDPTYWADFHDKNPDVEVSFEFGISDADIYGKMKAGSQVDAFHAYTGWLEFYVDEGLVAEIDTSRLTNWDSVPDSFKAVGQIDGKQYFVPFDWGFTSIMYRTDKVAADIDSWAALFEDDYAGHISMWDDGPAAVTVSSYIHGWDETNITDEQLAQIRQEWTAQAPLNRTYWTAEYGELDELFRSGEVWLAYAWQGVYATLLGEGVPVAYADPREGRNSWVGVYGIRADSPNYDLALAFLDDKLGELTGTNLVTNFYYGHANGDVMASITDETLIEAFSLDDPDVLERTNFTPNLTAEQRDAWTAMWADVKASQ